MRRVLRIAMKMHENLFGFLRTTLKDQPACCGTVSDMLDQLALGGDLRLSGHQYNPSRRHNGKKHCTANGTRQV
jgi:hypothetical protein